MDIYNIIQSSGHRLNFVAEKLFPKNKHPYNALNRVISEGRELNESQIIALAELTRQSADEMLGIASKGRLTPGGLLFNVKGFDVVYAPASSVCAIEKGGVEVDRFVVPSEASVSAFLKGVEMRVNELV